MQELTKALDKKRSIDFDADEGEFTEAAAHWAAHCIRRLQGNGDLLERGLAIAKAMTFFEDGLLHPETLKADKKAGRS